MGDSPKEGLEPGLRDLVVQLAGLVACRAYDLRGAKPYRIPLVMPQDWQKPFTTSTRVRPSLSMRATHAAISDSVPSWSIMAL